MSIAPANAQPVIAQMRSSPTNSSLMRANFLSQARHAPRGLPDRGMPTSEIGRAKPLTFANPPRLKTASEKGSAAGSVAVSVIGRSRGLPPSVLICAARRFGLVY